MPHELVTTPFIETVRSCTARAVFISATLGRRVARAAARNEQGQRKAPQSRRESSFDMSSLLPSEDYLQNGRAKSAKLLADVRCQRLPELNALR